MNVWTEVIKEAKRKIFNILVLRNNELISQGTGSCIRNDGLILTARHVIDVIDAFKDDKERALISIEVFNPFTKRLFYQPTYSAYSIDIAVINIINIDLCVIYPIMNKTNYGFFDLDDNSLMIGEDVVMAGYSEEMPFPLKIDFERIAMQEFENNPKEDKEIIKSHIDIMKPPVFKKGMISSIYPIDIANVTKGSMIHMDNGMHSGSSGGPIIRQNGSLAGIITDRAVVKTKVMVEDKLVETEIPSGNTFGLSVSLAKPIKVPIKRTP